jgi:hypothetical protein
MADGDDQVRRDQAAMAFQAVTGAAFIADHSVFAGDLSLFA